MAASGQGSSVDYCKVTRQCDNSGEKRTSARNLKSSYTSGLELKR